jgi:hypothetical protein
MIRVASILFLFVFFQAVFAATPKLILREFEVSENDPVRFAGQRSPERIIAVMARAMAAEGLGELIVDSVEVRNRIPSERIITPWKVVQQENIPRDQVGGSAYVAEYQVCRKDSVVYRFASLAIDKPAYTLRSTVDSWVLEASYFRRVTGDGWSGNLENTVVVDGVELNREFGYDLCYGYRDLEAKPFYFFERDGQIGWSYGGVEYRTDYETILHDRCCKEVLTNPLYFQNAVSFFALREGDWIQVVGMVTK